MNSTAPSLSLDLNLLPTSSAALPQAADGTGQTADFGALLDMAALMAAPPTVQPVSAEANTGQQSPASSGAPGLAFGLPILAASGKDLPLPGNSQPVPSGQAASAVAVSPTRATIQGIPGVADPFASPNPLPHTDSASKASSAHEQVTARESALTGLKTASAPVPDADAAVMVLQQGSTPTTSHPLGKQPDDEAGDQASVAGDEPSGIAQASPLTRDDMPASAPEPFGDDRNLAQPATPASPALQIPALGVAMHPYGATVPIAGPGTAIDQHGDIGITPSVGGDVADRAGRGNPDRWAPRAPAIGETPPLSPTVASQIAPVMQSVLPAQSSRAARDTGAQDIVPESHVSVLSANPSLLVSREKPEAALPVITAVVAEDASAKFSSMTYGVSLAGQAPAPTTASSLTMPSRAGEQPQDFAALVDRLIAARDSGNSPRVSVSVNHAEFGAVQVNFRHEMQGLTVSLASADPDFTRAVNAAAPPVVPPAGPNPAPAASASPDQAALRGGAGGQSDSNQRASQDRRDDHAGNRNPRSNPSHPQPRADNSRAGIFA